MGGGVGLRRGSSGEERSGGGTEGGEGEKHETKRTHDNKL